MARSFLICLVIVLLVAPSVFARKHPEGAGHHNHNGTRTGGHHKGGHHKGGGASMSGLTSSKGVTARKACSKSSLGYKASVDLTGKGLLFHWTVSGSNLNAAIEAKSTSGASGGYVSVGFSSNGKMFPADAVVGINGGSVKAYKLNSYTSYTPSKVLTISQTSLKATSSSLVVKFSRPAKGGLVSINLNGKNNVIWAFGKNKKFETHTPKDRGSKSVDLSCVA